MYISQVVIKGFRNFKHAKIKLTEKNLIFGANDIGKSNFIYALRLLLDKSLSERDLEPSDSDFYAFDEVNKFEIEVTFSDVEEPSSKDDCIRAKFKGSIGEDNSFILKYEAIRDVTSGTKIYKLYEGYNSEDLKEIECRHYLKVLNLEYVNSNRDLKNYIKKEQIRVVQEAKEKRENDTIIKDSSIETGIKNMLESVSTEINNLSYINQATSEINKELCLINLNECENIEFNAGNIDTNKYLNNLNLVSKVKGKYVELGGDGRSNQIFLTMWANKHLDDSSVRECIKIYCIEEPEAHLHPHKQRSLAKYLTDRFDSQVILTTHSPQIACEFSPDSMIKLFNNENGTVAAQEGCSALIEESFKNFGYRLNIIPAEAFFSDVVFLVEGVSEVLFYKAFAAVNPNINLDALNISILSVEGVGFEPYIEIFSKLKIPVVVRTDNDISKVPYKEEYRLAGFERIRSFYNLVCCKQDIIETKFLRKSSKEDFSNTSTINMVNSELETFKTWNLFLADKDFETDLAHSSLVSALFAFYELDSASSNIEELIQEMKSSKGKNIYKFLELNKDKLKDLKADSLLLPLYRCKEIVESLRIK